MDLTEENWDQYHERHLDFYHRYLDSSEWRSLRARLLEERGYKCETCSNSENLHLHHLTYARLGKELDTDLRILCKECHDIVHDKDHPKDLDRYVPIPSKNVVIGKEWIVIAGSEVFTITAPTSLVAVREVRNSLPEMPNMSRMYRAIELDKIPKVNPG